MGKNEGKIFLSCGHEDPDKPAGWTVFYQDYSEWKVGEMAIVCATYCSKCTAARILLEPDNTWFSLEAARAGNDG